MQNLLDTKIGMNDYIKKQQSYNNHIKNSMHTIFHAMQTQNWRESAKLYPTCIQLAIPKTLPEPLCTKNKTDKQQRSNK